jgi:hypothetical protein
MGLSNIIRSGVAIANSLTTDLQVPVQHYAWIGDDDFNKPIFANPVTRYALVEMKERMLHFQTGEDFLAKCTVTFLVPIAPNGASGRREPIDNRDKIVLPNGFTGPIRDVLGLANNFSDSPYVVEVILG